MGLVESARPRSAWVAVLAGASPDVTMFFAFERVPVAVVIGGSGTGAAGSLDPVGVLLATGSAVSQDESIRIVQVAGGLAILAAAIIIQRSAGSDAPATQAIDRPIGAEAEA